MLDKGPPKQSAELFDVIGEQFVGLVPGFNAAALEVASKFAVVTIEKWQGCTSNGYT
jgi:hypothetical protein